MSNHLYRDRPKNLDLRTIRLPINALVSILHRLSGCVLFLLIPIILFTLFQTLKSENDFNNLKFILALPKLKIIYFVLLWPFFHHFYAGIRHLAMDIHFATSLVKAIYTGKVVLILGFVSTLIVMVLL
ncbi:SdhC Succinate dehydrogenase/fumarate reductase, cytochrome b subunit [Candidatus Methylopumilus planktonicus]|uniref:succinate dehydrogenase, cytochrome b556 subunit n=1 Tax=Candidatus Methylopumilus planktonicus TaxID=1581557 RepID=UPI003BEF1963